jgi:uncharacterized protein (TIRG00374 family)
MLSIGLRLAAASAVSALFLYYAFHTINVDQLLAYMTHIEPLGLAFYVGGLCLTQVARAARWGLLVQPFATPPWRTLWRISNVGNMMIMLMPLRLGELARPYLMRQACGAPLSASMGAAVIERVLDGLLVTLLFFAATWLQGPAYPISPALQAGAQLALAVFSGALAALWLTMYSASLVPTLIRATLGRISPAISEKVIAMLLAFITGLRALPSIQAVLGVVAWTLVYWASNALGMYALMGAFGWDLPVIAGFTVVCVLVIGVMIPAGPGLLGTYQAAIIAGLSIYGVPQSAGAAFSVVAYLGNLAIVIGFALPALVGRNRLRVSLLGAPSAT